MAILQRHIARQRMYHRCNNALLQRIAQSKGIDFTSGEPCLLSTRDSRQGSPLVSICSDVPCGHQRDGGISGIGTSGRVPDTLLVMLLGLNFSLLAAEILGTSTIGFLGDKPSGHIMVEHNIQFQNTDQVVAEVV